MMKPKMNTPAEYPSEVSNDSNDNDEPIDLSLRDEKYKTNDEIRQTRKEWLRLISLSITRIEAIHGPITPMIENRNARNIVGSPR